MWEEHMKRNLTSALCLKNENINHNKILNSF